MTHATHEILNTADGQIRRRKLTQHTADVYQLTENATFRGIGGGIANIRHSGHHMTLQHGHNITVSAIYYPFYLDLRSLYISIYVTYVPKKVTWNMKKVAMGSKYTLDIMLKLQRSKQNWLPAPIHKLNCGELSALAIKRNVFVFSSFFIYAAVAQCCQLNLQKSCMQGVICGTRVIDSV